MTPPAAMTSPITPSDNASLQLGLAPDVISSLGLLGNIDSVLTAVPLCLARFITSLGSLQTLLFSPSPPLARVWDERHAFGRLRLYQPLQPTGTALLYLHGGGFVLCGLRTHDGLCRAIAARTGLTIASLEYRLAPEHPLPAPQQDTLHAYQHLATRWRRVAVGGDSAGGNLAASLCLQLALARAGRSVPPLPLGEEVAPLTTLAATPMPALQLLIYPALDLASASPSHAMYARGWLLSARLRDFFWGHYLGPEGQAREALKRHVLVSPLRAEPAALAGLCPALVLTAEYDILHDEGVQYVQALQASGVQAEHMEARGLYHGFATQTELKTGALALQAFCDRAAALLQ